jgi:DNA gyrase subunit A
MSRIARGVKGINTCGGKVVGMATSEEGNLILTITENGYGKKSRLDDYRLTHRGAKGVTAVKITDKTGGLVCMRSVKGDEDCMIMTDSGIIIRISLNQLSVIGRNSQGVKVINVKDETKVSAVSILDPEEEENTEEPEERSEEIVNDDMSEAE